MMTAHQRNIVLKHLGNEVEFRRRRLPERCASVFQDVKDSATVMQEEMDAFEAAQVELLAMKVAK